MAEKTFISFYLKSSTIRVFTKSVKLLEYPKYVRLLINPTKLQLAMTAYNRKELTSFRVPNGLLNDECKNTSLCFHSKMLCSLVSAKMGWIPGKSYRIPGASLNGNKGFVFYLSDAFEVTR